MARNQKNYAYQLYNDDNQQGWNVMAETGGALAGVDGHQSPNYAYSVFGRQTVRRHPRKVQYKDAATGRSVVGIIFTPEAYNAILAGSTVQVQVPGDATTVTYTVARKIAEKMPLPSAGTHLAY